MLQAIVYDWVKIWVAWQEKTYKECSENGVKGHSERKITNQSVNNKIWQLC